MANMIKVPSTQIEFDQTFASEKDCVDFLIEKRWPDGIRCSHCGEKKLWRSGNFFQCSACGLQTRVMSGTIFQDTHLPLLKWFRAIWYIVNQKLGANATDLSQLLGINFVSSGRILHKLRRVMVNPGQEKLTGTVEIGEAFIGGLEEGNSGRNAKTKKLVIIAIELIGNKIGRVRPKLVNPANDEEILQFIQENVEKNSNIITDGLKGYSKVNTLGYKHTVKELKSDNETLPHFDIVYSLFIRWLFDTLHGRINTKYLAYYLVEYFFRFNRRQSRSPGKLFLQIIELAIHTSPVKCRDLGMSSNVTRKK
jgi:transposase-like protein